MKKLWKALKTGLFSFDGRPPDRSSSTQFQGSRNDEPDEAQAESGGSAAEKAVERFDPEGSKQPEGEWGLPEAPRRGRRKFPRVESTTQDGSIDPAMVAKALLPASESPFPDSDPGGLKSTRLSNASRLVVR